jgi:hypothetical protein
VQTSSGGVAITSCNGHDKTSFRTRWGPILGVGVLVILVMMVFKPGD